jgi:hypothetical protein
VTVVLGLRPFTAKAEILPEQVIGCVVPGGRAWDGTTAKDEAISDWCERVSKAGGADWRYIRINQTGLVHRRQIPWGS